MKIRDRKYKPRECRGCGEQFAPDGPRRTICEGCRACSECGGPMASKADRIEHGPRVCMDCYKARAKPPGSTYVHRNGYVLEKLDDGTWEYQHRVVMARNLGRALLPGEIVHHVNRNRADNRPENLELCNGLREHLEQHHADDLKDPPRHHNGRKRRGDPGFIDHWMKDAN